MVSWAQKVCCPNSIPIYPREGAILRVFGTLKSAETFYYTLRSKKLTICASYDVYCPFGVGLMSSPIYWVTSQKTILEREKEARPGVARSKPGGLNEAGVV